MRSLFRLIWRLVIAVVLANAAAFAAVNIAKRSMRLRDDPGSNEFDLVSVNDGVAFSSSSPALRFATDPNNQLTRSLSENGLGDRFIANAVIEPAKLDNPTPTRMRRVADTRPAPNI